MKTLFIFLILAAATNQARADFITAADLSGNVSVALGQPANTTIGFAFTVGANPFTFNALGLDSGTGSLSTPISVHLWQSGTTTNLAQANISNSNSLSTNGRYYYVPILPVTLLANTTYDIGADLPFLNQGAMVGGTVVHDPDITAFSAVSGNAGTFPTADNNHINAGPLFGPTLGVVPEPSSLILAGLAAAFGGIAVGAHRRNTD